MIEVNGLPPLKQGRSRAYHELGHLQTVTRDLDRRVAVRKVRGKW